MSDALGKLLEAAADLSVAEMREIKKGIENRIPARVSAAYDTVCVSAAYDTVCALNEWGQTRRAQPQAQLLPLDAKTEPGGVTYVPNRDAMRVQPERADKYSPPTMDDVKHLVGLALPAFVRIHQLRRLLGMSTEGSNEVRQEMVDGTEKARRVIRAWVHRAAPFTQGQMQDMLDTIAECLGEQQKD